MNNSRRHESNAFFVKGGTDIIRVIIINKREEKWEKKNWKKNQIKPSKKRGTKQERERWETSPYKSTAEQKWSPQSYESTTTEFPNHRQIQKENHERACRWSFQLICSLMESDKASRHARPQLLLTTTTASHWLRLCLTYVAPLTKMNPLHSFLDCSLTSFSSPLVNIRAW